MTENYASRWTNQFGVDPTDRWCVALTGATKDKLARAFQKMGVFHPTFPPTPFEFENMLKTQPEDIGLPSYSDAMNTAKELWFAGRLQYKDLHPCFYHMKKHGWFDVSGFRKMTDREESKFDAEFKKAMDICMEHIRLGRQFDVCPDQIEEINNPPVSKKEGIEKARALRAALFAES